MTEQIPDKQKLPYERPSLGVYGSVESLTKIGTSGADEAGSNSGSKKRTSLM